MSEPIPFSGTHWFPPAPSPIRGRRPFSGTPSAADLCPALDVDTDVVPAKRSVPELSKVARASALESKLEIIVSAVIPAVTGNLFDPDFFAVPTGLDEGAVGPGTPVIVGFERDENGRVVPVSAPLAEVPGLIDELFDPGTFEVPELDPDETTVVEGDPVVVGFDKDPWGRIRPIYGSIGGGGGGGGGGGTGGEDGTGFTMVHVNAGVIGPGGYVVSNVTLAGTVFTVYHSRLELTEDPGGGSSTTPDCGHGDVPPGGGFGGEGDASGVTRGAPGGGTGDGDGGGGGGGSRDHPGKIGSCWGK